VEDEPFEVLAIDETRHICHLCFAEPETGEHLALAETGHICHSLAAAEVKLGEHLAPTTDKI
tara:strand:+ start:684 stop:869 length:186 start_codon:yes stop_codon:yes gene_type:complete